MRSLQKLKRCGSALRVAQCCYCQEKFHPSALYFESPSPLYTPKHTLATTASGSSALLLSVSILNTSRFYRLNCGQFSDYFFSVLVVIIPCTILKLMCSRNKHIVNYSEFVPKLVCYNYGWVLCKCYLILYFCIILYLKKHYNLLWPVKCCSLPARQPPRQA